MGKKNQFEMIHKVKQSAQTEVLDQKEVEKRAIDTIVALVNQANAISAENSSVEEAILYEDIDDPKTYIDKIAGYESKANEEYAKLQKMKKSHFWTIGRNKAKVEKTQEVLDDIIKAVNNNANAAKALFNNQVKMAVLTKKLYAIGLMGIASNRIVVREIKKKLEHASKEELSNLARKELEATLYELNEQQRIEKKIDDSQNVVLELIDDNQKDALDKYKSINKDIISNKELFDQKLSEVNELINQQTKKVDDNHKDVLEIIDSIRKTVISNKEQLETKIDEETERKNIQIKQIIDNFSDLSSTIDSYDKRLCILENKSFFDSTIYKIVVGIAAIGAFIISILSYFS